MTRLFTRSRLLAALVALVVGLCVLGPAMEAAACGAEVETSHAAALLDDGHGEDSAGDAPHGVCAHGHCHHAAFAIPQGFDASNGPLIASAMLGGTGDGALRSRVPDGLKRPPRS